jgi:predicted phosphodiesterase
MIFWGDPHGNLDLLRRKMKEQHTKFPNDTQISVGDNGFGFPKSQSIVFPDYFKMIRGNHDSPEVCRAHPNYLGDYGTKEIDGYKVFFVSGGWSIDRQFRKEGVSWWPDEELSIAELNIAMEEYLDVKPDVMLSHDGPTPATHYILNRYALQNNNYYSESSVTPTRTGQALSAMFREYQPKMWIFGHWHCNFDKIINGTRFICIPELESIRVEDILPLDKDIKI